MVYTEFLKALAQEIVYEEKELDVDNPECPECGGTMHFYGHDKNGDWELEEGYWECPNCGLHFDETEVWEYTEALKNELGLNS